MKKAPEAERAESVSCPRLKYSIELVAPNFIVYPLDSTNVEDHGDIS